MEYQIFKYNSRWFNIFSQNHLNIFNKDGVVMNNE